jgi:hypothetical protein
MLIGVLSMVFAASPLFVSPAGADVPTVQATLERVTETSSFYPPSPDPAGITYVPDSNTLLICDSEVDEMPPYFTGINLFEVTLSGQLIGTATTLPFSHEPTGLAFDSLRRKIYISDDDWQRVFALDPGADGEYNTSDDIVTYFKTSAFGCKDPEDVAFDSRRGHLFVVDGAGTEVYDIAPGANAVFDGPPPSGDDVITHFDTAVIGITDPEGIAYNPENNHLYILGSRGKIAETTIEGTLLRYINAYGLIRLGAGGGMACAPSSVDGTRKNLYIVARGIDNSQDPLENDGRLYEISFPPLDDEHPVPVTMGLSPLSTAAGGAAFTLTVTGGNFVSGSVVHWNGAARTTTYVSATQVEAAITAADIATAGTASITVFNPAPGGGTSNVQTFTINAGDNPVPVTVSIASSKDDAEEGYSGAVNLTSTDLEMVYKAAGNQTIGLRFNGVSVPRGATIVSSHPET